MNFGVDIDEYDRLWFDQRIFPRSFIANPQEEVVYARGSEEAPDSS
jgi:hypothetical protein